MNKQKGSAHVVVIVVLVVALLGALGFILWQNFINKPAAKSDIKQTSKNTQDTTKSTPVKVSNAKFESDELTFEYPKTGWKEVAGQQDSVAEINTDDYTPSIGMGLDSGASIAITHTMHPVVPVEISKNVQEVTIDGQKGYKYEMEYEGHRLQALFSKDGTGYVITMQTTNTPDDNDKEVFDLVLGTLHIK